MRRSAFQAVSPWRTRQIRVASIIINSITKVDQKIATQHHDKQYFFGAKKFMFSHHETGFA
jgi:hypothetical protein